MKAVDHVDGGFSSVGGGIPTIFRWPGIDKRHGMCLYVASRSSPWVRVIVWSRVYRERRAITRGLAAHNESTRVDVAITIHLDYNPLRGINDLNAVPSMVLELIMDVGIFRPYNGHLAVD